MAVARVAERVAGRLVELAATQADRLSGDADSARQRYLEGLAARLRTLLAPDEAHLNVTPEGADRLVTLHRWLRHLDQLLDLPASDGAAMTVARIAAAATHLPDWLADSADVAVASTRSATALDWLDAPTWVDAQADDPASLPGPTAVDADWILNRLAQGKHPVPYVLAEGPDALPSGVSVGLELEFALGELLGSGAIVEFRVFDGSLELPVLWARAGLVVGLQLAALRAHDPLANRLRPQSLPAAAHRSPRPDRVSGYRVYRPSEQERHALHQLLDAIVAPKAVKVAIAVLFQLNGWTTAPSRGTGPAGVTSPPDILQYHPTQLTFPELPPGTQLPTLQLRLPENPDSEPTPGWPARRTPVRARRRRDRSMVQRYARFRAWRATRAGRERA